MYILMAKKKPPKGQTTEWNVGAARVAPPAPESEGRPGANEQQQYAEYEAGHRQRPADACGDRRQAPQRHASEQDRDAEQRCRPACHGWTVSNFPCCCQYSLLFALRSLSTARRCPRIA